MKYYYQKPKEWVGAGETYICNHPLYNYCTLFRNGKIGLAIVQERFNEKTKFRWWGTIDPWLAGDIYFNKNFRDVFLKNASECDENDIYPTLTVRKIMWMLRMKPLKKEVWEESL